MALLAGLTISFFAFFTCPGALAQSVAGETPGKPSVDDIRRQANDALDQKNYEAAMRLFLDAAKQTDAEAENSIGFMYDNGLGVKKDAAAAAHWYGMAAEHGLPKAQYNIGLDYESGSGVPADRERARCWMQKAADAGDEDARVWVRSQFHSPPPNARTEWERNAGEHAPCFVPLPKNISCTIKGPGACAIGTHVVPGRVESLICGIQGKKKKNIEFTADPTCNEFLSTGEFGYLQFHTSIDSVSKDGRYEATSPKAMFVFIREENLKKFLDNLKN